jgi:diguanylate cyclase (GGDEF)-like protein
MAAPARGPRRTESGEHESPTRPFDIIGTATRDRVVLVETVGIFAGRPHRVPVEGANLGRSAECAVCIGDDTLSRVHARIVRVGREVVFEDLGSLNGCFVGDERVQRAVLHDGDRVRLGPRVALQFHLLTPDEEAAMVRLYDAGLRDPLTGLANRRQLEETLNAELSFARRHETDLSIVVVDVDHFKRINDAHGHLVGDTALRHVAQVMAATVRTEDVVARFGGEEFVIVARGIALWGAHQAAERVRVALDRAPILVEGVPLRLTASFGVASMRCVPSATVATLLARADSRMYRAKSYGRNRVVASG